MRTALANLNSDLMAKNHKYVMRITGDNDEGKKELDNFIDPEQTYPVIATTSELMTTGVDAQTCRIIVLDSEIASMTKFKQIIGRGTRVNEEYGKMYFTILDFRNVTDLFSDPKFDGIPERIKILDQDDELKDFTEEEETDTEDRYSDLIDEQPTVTAEPGSGLDREMDRGIQKVYINGVDVTVLNVREIYFDREGKIVTMNLKDFSRERLKDNFKSLEDFLQRWKESDKKEAIINELKEQGVPVDDLLDSVNRDCDLFDIICHVAFGQKPMTRRERAYNVKKRNYFTKYGEQAKKVLVALIDKYADEGIENLESMEVLKIDPFSDFGSPVEIVKSFGGKLGYLNAIKELEKEIYKII